MPGAIGPTRPTLPGRRTSGRPPLAHRTPSSPRPALEVRRFGGRTQRCGSGRCACSLTIGRTIHRTPRSARRWRRRLPCAGKRPTPVAGFRPTSTPGSGPLRFQRRRLRSARHSRTGPRGTRRRRFCRAASVCPNVIDVDRAVLSTSAPRYSHATKAAARSCRSRTSRTLAARGKSPRLGLSVAMKKSPLVARLRSHQVVLLKKLSVSLERRGRKGAEPTPLSKFRCWTLTCKRVDARR
jgi:hypothetical protein